ncbi:MAG: hypothetical protein KAT15_30120, partial [Bacteroidales bacterium]|nr:hypothetical protein [Bacteroidales bacterium]
VRHLIFTEWRGDSWPNAYIELTNVGDSTLHLDRFTLQSMPPNRTDFSVGPADAQVRLSGTLDPGEVFVAIPVMEALDAAGNPTTRTQVLPFADLLAFRDESGSSLPWDSISPFSRIFRLWQTYPSAIWYHLDNGDSVVVDAVNNGIRDNGTLGGEMWPVAGVPDATDTHILVRKANINQGNTNWETSRGVSTEDSEWIVVPEDAAGPGKPFTTLGTHGDHSISLTSSTINIDLANSKITVPWGIWKGDSITDEFVIGPGIAWHYNETAVWDDSIHVINQTGDILDFYACGNVVEKVSLEIEVSPPTDDMVLVFPTLVQDEELNWSMPYYVTQDQPGIDTIGSVPFATRIDSLYSHLEKADIASWEIVFEDGVERPDLVNGDILRVTGADGSTVKDYFIDVEDYMASINALLGAITWPDMPGFVSDLWKGDTIPGFNPTSGIYMLKLPYGTTSVPALMPLPQDMNATIETDRAISLGGGMAERTTVFTVTAEDDTSVMVYNVTFEVEKDFSKLQKYEPEPFFVEFVARHKAQGCFTEIMNSGNTVLDMSKYMIVESKTTKNPAEAIVEFITESDDDYNNRFKKYVPGWKYTNDTTAWRANPAVLEIDPNVDPMVEP